MRYEQFFGLNDAPFSLAPNPRYLFESASHAAALQQLTHAIDRREPLIVMTGEIGTGKTLLCRTVLQRLDRKTFVSVINDPLLGPDDLIKQILEDFGVISKDRAVSTTASRHDLVHALEDFLSSLVPLNAHAVVIIDEAQHVRPDVLEQIRLLSNIDGDRGTMLQIVLAGQLDLEALLARPELRQFQQRVSRRVRLEPLAADELRSYIDHRIAVGRAAGSRMPGAGELAAALDEWDRNDHPQDTSVTFTADAVQAIWRISAGLPRVVNLVCDRALELAFAGRLRTIDGPLIESAAAALDLRPPAAAAPPVWAPSPLKSATTAAATAAADAPRTTTIEPVPDAGALERPRETFNDAAATPAPAAAETAAVPTPPRTKRLAALAAVLAVVAVATWLITRASTGSVTDAQGIAPRSAPAPPQPTATAPAATPAPPPAAPAASAGPPPTTPAPSTPAPPPEAAAAPPPRTVPTEGAAAARGAGPAGSGTALDIVVASFRTESRAASVAAQVSGAGLPVHRRSVAGWQQVLAGPFATREQAEQAQQKLVRVGLSGTQIVVADR